VRAAAVRGNTRGTMAIADRLAARAGDAPRRRRRVLRAAATTVAVIAALLLADAALTLAWQEPLTALIGTVHQHGLAGELRRVQQAGPTPAERRGLLTLHDRDARLAYLARSLRGRVAEGHAAGRIKIPAIHTNMVVVSGSDAQALRRGPGFYDGSPFPGQPGTVAIAGHRTTYLAPFRHLDALHTGDAIVISMPYATFTYAVQRTRIVSPSALWILRRGTYDRLVLSACHPLFSAARRIVVFARLMAVHAPRAV
jgi:sortase A